MWYVPILKGLDGALIVVLSLLAISLLLTGKNAAAWVPLTAIALILVIGALVGALFL